MMLYSSSSPTTGGPYLCGVRGRPDPYDDDGHGSNVAGIGAPIPDS